MELGNQAGSRIIGWFYWQRRNGCRPLPLCMSKTELAVTRQWFGFWVYLCLPVYMWRPEVDLKYLPLLSLLIYSFIYLFMCEVKVYLHVCVQVHKLVRMHRKARGGCQVAPITPPVPLGAKFLSEPRVHSFSNQCPLSGLH